MNTDKLVELERKWRAEAEEGAKNNDQFYTDHYAAARGDCADELAAALRAEQAVGDEQIARELAEIATWHRRMNLELSGKGSEWAAKEMYACRHGKFAETLERALGTARRSEGVVLEGLFAPRYVADGPEGMFGTDDLELAGKLIARGADDPDEWTVTDLTETGIEATKEAAAPGGEGEG